MKANIREEDIKVIVKMSENPKLIATAKVILFEIIETNGWRIAESDYFHEKFQEYIWIQPPAYKVGGKWKTTIFIEDPEQYKIVEECIYNAYFKVKTSTKSSSVSDEEKDEYVETVKENLF